MMHGFYQKIYACLRSKQSGFNKKLDSFKKKIFTGFEDKIILEIGAGVGNNLPYYKNARIVFLAEPNIYNHSYILKTSKNLGLNVKIISDYAEKLSLNNNLVDVVVCNFVLCSVVNPIKVLMETVRVLKSGGRFIFIEHVASGKGINKILQRMCRPVWKLISNGCDCYRYTQYALKDFENVMKFEYQLTNKVPSIFLKPWIIGTAWKK